MDDLDYELHLQRYHRLFGVTPDSLDENARAAELEAQHMHAMCVFNPLGDCIGAVVDTAQKLRNENARYYMRYGAGQRFSMLFEAYRQITLSLPPDRTEPLEHDLQQSLSRDINVLYMNTRGVLDNLAWCLLYERHADKTDSVDRSQVDLFHPNFSRVCPSFSDIASEMKLHAAWNKNMKARRDPVAHRIPLYIPNSVVTEEEGERYATLNQRLIDLAVAGQFEESDRTFEEIGTIGRFVPYFLHHPQDGPIPIYPTVPTDMAHVVRITRVLRESLVPR